MDITDTINLNHNEAKKLKSILEGNLGRKITITSEQSGIGCKITVQTIKETYDITDYESW
jgi:hypothetical protein